MSDDKQNQGNQAANTPVAPTPPPLPAPSPPQPPNAPMPSEDPFALDPRLIGEIQKGGDKPKQTAIQKPEIVRTKPVEKK